MKGLEVNPQSLTSSTPAGVEHVKNRSAIRDPQFPTDRERAEVLAWLREENPARLGELWARADAMRREHVGEAVHLRGLIEISNTCVRQCHYCGLRAPNDRIERYRMSAEDILACAARAVEFGCGTVVLQSGEDPGLTCDFIADLIRRIKAQTPLAVTLSLGERDPDELAAWRKAGADRYLLRFETSNRELYERIHPGGKVKTSKSQKVKILNPPSAIRGGGSRCCTCCGSWGTRLAAV